MFAWGTEDHHLWSRFTVSDSLLGAIACIPRDTLDPQFVLSPVEGWPNGVSPSNP
jgi:hypothetical protein